MEDRVKNTSTMRHRVASWVTTIVIAVALIALLWFANRLITPNIRAQEFQPLAHTSETWPTVPPTYTPLPAPTALATATALASPTPMPTATPIPVPVWRSLSELAVAEFTLSTVVQAVSPPDYLRGKVGTDQVILRTVGNVKVGIDLSKVTASTHGTAISVTLPPVAVVGVELLPGRSEIISSQQRWILSDYTGLETQALEKARLDLTATVRDSPSMMGLAQELLKYRMTDHLRSLGFTDIAFR